MSLQHGVWHMVNTQGLLNTTAYEEKTRQEEENHENVDKATEGEIQERGRHQHNWKVKKKRINLAIRMSMLGFKRENKYMIFSSLPNWNNWEISQEAWGKWMLKALPLLLIKLVLQTVSATGQASGFPNMELSIRVTFLVSDGPGWKKLRTHFLWSDLLLRRKKEGFNSRRPESSPVVISYIEYYLAH